MLKVSAAVLAALFVGCGSDDDGSSDDPDASSVVVDAAPDAAVVDTSQKPGLSWASSFGNLGEDLIADVVVDSEGNVYIVGTYQLGVSFGGEDHAVGDDQLHPYLASFDAEGNYRWSKDLGDEGLAILSVLDVAPDDTVYWTSTVIGVLDFGVTTIEADNVQFFVSRYTPDGDAMWAVELGGTGVDTSPEVVVTDDHRVFFAGSFEGDANFGDGPVSSQGDRDIVALELDSNGNILWSHTVGNEGRELVRGLAVDDSGLYVSGMSSSTTLMIGEHSAPGMGGNDYLLVKYALSGEPMWAKRFGSSDDEEADGIALDPRGNLYVSGRFDTTLNLGGDTLTAVPKGNADLVFASFDANGNHRWSRALGGDSNFNENHRRVSVDAAGHVYFSGSNSSSDPPETEFPVIDGPSDPYVQQVDPDTGAVIWTLLPSGEGTDSFSGMAFTPELDLVVSGNFHGGDLTLDEDNVFSTEGSFDMVLGRYDYPE